MKYLLVMLSLWVIQLIDAPAAIASHRAQRNNDIREAVIRHVLRVSHYKDYFIYFMAKGFSKIENPPDSFIKRFAGSPARIRKGLPPKLFIKQEQADHLKGSKPSALQLSLLIKESTKSKAQVWVGCMYGGVLTLADFTVRKRGKCWQVTKITNIPIW